MKENNVNDAYMSYQSMVSQTNVSMVELGNVCEELGLEEHSGALKEKREKMKNKTFSVGIMGEFKRGKSTVINALLGHEIVPADIVPTSATLNYIRWGTKERAIVNFKDGTKKEVGVDELSGYITKITSESEKVSESVRDAEVYYPCQFCQNGVQIIDTPGLNDEDRMDEISESVIPTLDAVIMVLIPSAPFSSSEGDFVRNKLMTSDLGRIIFVVNKIDEVKEKDRPRILGHIKEKIQSSVLEKMANMYGEDSDEYKEAKNKLSGIRIFGISALNALEGRMNNDAERVEQSGILEFEGTLSALLTKERGMLELIAPVNSVLGIAKEARKTIAMRRDALQMDKQEFEQVTEEAIKSVEESREKKRQAVSETKDRASQLYAQLLPELGNVYDNIEAQLLDEVEQLPISPEEVSNEKKVDKKAEELSNQMKALTEKKLGEAAEILLTRIQNSVGNDIEKLQAQAQEMFTNIANIQSKLTQSKNDKLFDWGITAVDTVTNLCTPLFGIGGVLSGWRENGIKGAAVGGLAGFAAGGAATYATLLVCGSVLGMTTVAALPVMLIAGVASTFAGKGAVKAVFRKSIGEKNVQKVRSNLRLYVKETKTQLQSNRVLENWLKDTTNAVYNEIAENLNKEIEASLSGFESTLSQLRADKQMKESDIAKTVNEMDKLDEDLNKIAETIKPVKVKLAEALNLE